MARTLVPVLLLLLAPGVAYAQSGNRGSSPETTAVAGPAAVRGLRSEHYELIGGSLAAGASATLVSTAPVSGVSLSGATLVENAAGAIMAATSGVTLEPGFWPIVAAPEPGPLGSVITACAVLTSLGRRTRR